MRRVFLAVSAAMLALVSATALVWPPILWSLIVIVPLILRGVADMLQTSEGLAFVHYALVGTGVRGQIRLIASGKVNTRFQIATKIALGADMCNSARAMMFALGCIQALRCNTNQCPTAVATQDSELVRGLHVGDNSTRVARFHRETVKSFFEVLGAAGLQHPRDLKPWYVMRRVNSGEVRSYHDIYPPVEAGALLTGAVNGSLGHAWNAARPDTF